MSIFAKGRSLSSGAFAAAGSGESDATFTLSSTARGERDLRRVSAKVVGVPTGKAPKPSEVETDGKVEEVEIDKIRVGSAKLVRGRIARASRIVRNGIKADGDGVEPITVVQDGDGYVVVRGRGEHRVASLRLDGKTGKVPVKVVERKKVEATKAEDPGMKLVEKAGPKGKMKAVAGIMESRGLSEKDMVEAAEIKPERMKALMAGEDEPTDDEMKAMMSAAGKKAEKRDAEMGMTDYELRDAVGKAIRAAHGSCCYVLDLYPEAGMATFTKRPMNEMGYPDYSPGSEMLMRATYEVDEKGDVEIGEPEEVEHHFKPMGKAGVGREVEITLGWNEEENAHVVEGLEGDEANLLKRELVETGAVAECRWNDSGDRIAFRLTDARARGRDVLVKAYVEGEEVEADGDSDGAAGESILHKAEVLEGTEELAKAAKKGIVTLKVYGPNEVDSQGEYASAEDIEKAAFEYLEKSRLVKINHRDPAPGCSVVESWIAKNDWTVGDKVVKAGTWLVTMRLSKAAKKAFEDGRLTGCSMGGSCERE